MREDANFLFIGILPKFEDVVHSVNLLSKKDWDSYKKRKNLGGVAGGHTDTIPLIYDIKDALKYQFEHPMLRVFAESIDSISDMYSKKISCAYAARAFLTKMLPNSEIKSHKDKGEISAKTHRLHLSIITNTKCSFTVAEETKHLAPGEVWLIDNTEKYHSVLNAGATERIHLIVDLLHV